MDSGKSCQTLEVTTYDDGRNVMKQEMSNK